MCNFFDLPLRWYNEPKNKMIGNTFLELTTEPNTDFWQRTHYGFKHENAPALLTDFKNMQSMEAKTHFSFNKLYDQCGIFLYLDEENWAKIAIEFADKKHFWLGSVATNYGYSDWAFTTIPCNIKQMSYRISRKKNDFF